MFRALPIRRRTGAAGAAVGAVALALCAASTALAQDPPQVTGGFRRINRVDFSDRVVTFPAQDGITIEADWYPVKVEEGKRTPVAILVHMYPADRKSWKPLVEDLRSAGIAVLAYDIRGKGGSKGPEELKLPEAYEKRDSALFSNAWMDAAGAASWLGAQRNIATDRMAVVGASIGCSVAMNFGSSVGSPKAIVCLSPGTDYMGVPSKEHIQVCATYGIPMLLMSPEKEYKAVEELVEASGKKATGRKFDGGEEFHGTKMFEAPYGAKVKRAIVEFLCEKLELPVPKEETIAAAADDDKEKKSADKKKKKKSSKAKKKSSKTRDKSKNSNKDKKSKKKSDSTTGDN